MVYPSSSNQNAGARVLTGNCPDSKCGKQLYFPSFVATAIECTNCGQHHVQQHLLNVKPVSDPGMAIRSLLQTILEKSVPNRKGSDSVKVSGMSNYSCKLISPMLTTYGYDKASNGAKLLTDMGQGEFFDCAHLSDRAFMIDEQNLLVTGYGRDQTGSAKYLEGTLKEIADATGLEENLVPLHADGDGYCLLHAVSRALVGRELFWHPLMTHLKAHFAAREEEYKMLFKDFYEDSDWKNIIDESDPDFIPTNGEALGLRNIHIFGIANVLRRPIILLDCLDGMYSKGDYSGTFLPSLTAPLECRGKDGSLNKPIIVGWSSRGRNHFVPVVGIKEKGVPVYPMELLPKPWGVPQELLTEYIEFDQDNRCQIGGKKVLPETYIQRLASAMERKFQDLYDVSPAIVVDVYEHILKQHGIVGLSTTQVIEATQIMTKEERLYRCLHCYRIGEEALSVPVNWLVPGGELYQTAVGVHGTLKDQYQYKFPRHNNVTCRYSLAKDRLLLVIDISTIKCKQCGGNAMRLVLKNGSIVYQNGDKTTSLSNAGRCGCGYKHYWDGKEYDNNPIKVPVTLEWNNRTEKDIVYFFQDEGDTSLNSNAFDLATNVVQKHFPGEFGSERVVQKVVDQIFMFVMKEEPKAKQKPISLSEMPEHSTPTKIILTGEKSKSIHKEELTANKAEKIVRKKIEHGAATYQKRLSRSPIKTPSSTSSSSKSTLSEDTSMDMAIDTKEAASSSRKENLSSEYHNSTGTSNSAPSEPKKSATEKKIRITAGDKGNAMFPFNDSTKFSELQNFIYEKFDIFPSDQVIKAGFPPRRIDSSIIAKNESLPFKNGERVMVEGPKALTATAISTTEPSSDATITPLQEPLTMQIDVSSSSSGNVPEETQTSQSILNTNIDTGDKDPQIDVSAMSKKLMDTLRSVDLWPWAQNQPHLFQPEGLFFIQTEKDLGGFKDGQHFSIPCFPLKLFVYSAKDNEILLCLGKHHTPIQELTPQLLDLANQQGLAHRTSNQDGHMVHPVQAGHRAGHTGQMSEEMPKKPFYRIGNATKTYGSSSNNTKFFSGAGHSLALPTISPPVVPTISQPLAPTISQPVVPMIPTISQQPLDISLQSLSDDVNISEQATASDVEMINNTASVGLEEEKSASNEPHLETTNTSNKSVNIEYQNMVPKSCEQVSADEHPSVASETKLSLSTTANSPQIALSNDANNSQFVTLNDKSFMTDEEAMSILVPPEQRRSNTNIVDSDMNPNDDSAKCGQAIMELARHITGQSEISAEQRTDVDLDNDVDEMQ